MAWSNDPYWVESLNALACMSPNHVKILVPNDWYNLDGRYYPLDYGYALNGEQLTGFAIPKDDVDHLPYWLIAANFKGMKCIYANPVFVIYSSLKEDWFNIDELLVNEHLPAFLEITNKFLTGNYVRYQAINPKHTLQTLTDSHILIVNASHMGNFGDELLAEAAIKLVKKADQSLNVMVVRPDYIPSPTHNIEAIVLGGGGIIYDFSISGIQYNSELVNICNYFKYAYIARQRGIPFFVLGIGDQHHLNDFISIDARDYVRNALIHASYISTRDAVTAKRLTRVLYGTSAPEVVADIDLAFYYIEVKSEKHETKEKQKIGLVGQIFDYSPAIKIILDELNTDIYEICFFSQANEDPEHYEKLLSICSHLNIKHIDLRAMNTEVGLRSLETMDLIITTRFHSLVVALCYGVQVIALCKDNDKKQRLIEGNNLEVTTIFSEVTPDAIKKIFKNSKKCNSQKNSILIKKILENGAINI